MKLSCLLARLDRMPVLKLLVPFAAGIALARLTASLPGGAADYTLGGWQTATLYLVFVLATAAAWSAEPKKSVPLRT